MEINGFKIEPQHGKAGVDIPINISVTAANEELDKIIEVDGVCGDEQSTLVLVHKGMREEYITADDEVYMTVDDEIYGVIKG